MGIADEIGDRAQWIAALRLTAYRSPAGALFRPCFLGDKCATFDYFVELAGAKGPVPLLFIQVKGTRQGCTPGHTPHRLKVTVPASDVRKMASYPAPAYVVGVDEVNEACFLLGIEATRTRAISTVPTLYPFTDANLGLLWEEVKGYWEAQGAVRKESRFTLQG
jgi:hypothetical protein